MFSKAEVIAYLKGLSVVELEKLLASSKAGSMARVDQFFTYQGYQILQTLCATQGSPMPEPKVVGYIICALEGAAKVQAAMTEQKAKDTLN